MLSEYYFTLTQKLTPRIAVEEAWEDVKSLVAWHPHAIDARLLAQAREVETRWCLSWWDRMIVAAAQLEGCSLLLTEDLHEGAMYGDVTVRSPFTMDAREPVAAYAATPIPRHRPRGRPPKRVGAR